MGGSKDGRAGRTRHGGRGLRTAALVVAATVAGLAFAPAAAAEIFWANTGTTSAIGSATLSGGSVNHTLIAADLPCGVAADGEYVYWANPVTDSIGRAELDGEDVDPTFITGADEPCGVAVDGEHIYWANSAEASETIGRATLDGSGVDQSFITGGAVPTGVAVNAEHIFWTNAGTPNSIGRANVDGTGVNQSFITDPASPIGIAVDRDHVYWTNGVIGSFSIGRADIDGGNEQQAFITEGVFVPSGVAVDGEHVYWTNFGANTVARAKLDGTDVDPEFITDADNPFGVAVAILSPPACSGVAVSSRHAEPVEIRLDCAGSGLKHAIASAAANGTLSNLRAARGTVTYTPRRGFFGQDGFTASAANSLGSDTAAVTIEVRPASNLFRLGKAKRKRKRGTARLPATVPGEGRLVLRGRAVRRSRASTARARTVRLRVKPRGRKLRRLEATGRARVRVKVTFRPVGGRERTLAKRVRLVKRRAG
ncbi:MAG TPA: hypothetical protein VK919_11670 [Solirubrobacterales bacterium]|nr:hypothetical protein [Solirubrobacterales bacterium]